MRLPAILRWSIAAVVLPVAWLRRHAGIADADRGEKAMPFSEFLSRRTPEKPGEKSVGKYELEAEALQRDIMDASVRNKAALDAGSLQTQEVLSFEERSRETLRALMIDMGRGNDDDTH